jgi:alpha-beta hydrolase superfamily lysophospholipase
MGVTGGDEHDEGLFEGARGQKLFYQRRLPEGPVRAVLAIVRGAGDFRGLYSAVVDALVPRGFAVFGFDHREHTRRPGQKGYPEEWSQSQRDVRAFVRLVEQQLAGRPVFLLGNGLGGFIALTYAFYHPKQLAGVAAFGPVSAEGAVQPLLTRVSRTMAGILPAPLPVAEAGTRSEPRLRPGTKHELVTSPAEAIAAVEETGTTVGELSLPHLIVRRAPDQAAPDDSQLDDPDYAGLLAEFEDWVRDRLRGT